MNESSVLDIIRTTKFDRNQLTRYATRIGSGRGAVEKDFVISCLLLVLTKSVEVASYRSQLAFRGGTCLKKVFFPKEMRFSEDLDFAGLPADRLESFYETMNSLVGKNVGVTTLTNAKPVRRDARGLDFSVGYTSVLGQRNSIMFNLSTSKPIENLSRKRVDVSPYFSQLRPTIMSMSIEEMLAEKVRALLQRTKPRDVFDVWFLIEKKHTHLHKQLLLEKLRRSYLATPPEKKEQARRYDMRAIIKSMRERVTRKAWGNEIGGLLLRDIPDLQEIIESVESIIQDLGDIKIE